MIKLVLSKNNEEPLRIHYSNPMTSDISPLLGHWSKILSFRIRSLLLRIKKE